MLLLSVSAQGAPARDLQFASLASNDQGRLVGELDGLRITSGEQARFIIEAESIRLVTVNETAPAYAQNAVQTTPGGRDVTFAQAFAESMLPKDDVDFSIFPLAGRPAPQLELNASRLLVTEARGSFQEVAYVETSRPTFSTETARSLEGTVDRLTDLRVTGDFAISIWSWDFEIDGQSIMTGSERNNVVTDSITGRELYADTVEQVAQLFLTNARLDVSNAGAATLYGTTWIAELPGTTDLTGLAGTLAAKGSPVLQGDGLRLTGASLELSRTQQPLVRVLHADQALLNGNEVQLYDQASTSGHATVRSPAFTRRWYAAPVGFVALILVAGALHGPMRGLQFSRVERRFEQRDYLAVLGRIDAFTRSRRFRRRASFLKAVSLLSLESYKEAALYLETLDSRGPDPATRFFLKACAAAGQGEDAVAIEHMTQCFALDKSYRQEAQAVPILGSLLPYFELAEGGSPS